MQVSDGYGRLRLTHDSNGSGTAGYSRMTLVGITNAAGSPPAVGIATLQVSDGFFSASGTTASIAYNGSATIGLLKKGMLMVSVQDTDTGNAYLGALGIVTVVGSTYTIRNLSSNAYNIYLSNSTSNLQIVNSDSFASHVYKYSITYFPSP
jgi:hypothetical protein